MKSENWQEVDHNLKVVTLSYPLRALIPALLVSAVPVRTRGVSFEGGRFGLSVGAMLVATTLALGFLLFPITGIAGPLMLIWLLGTTGVVMIANGRRPIAFVKPICVRCRLLPVIREHEAIHLSGVESDKQVWASMKTRHSCESLRLDGDPNICTFCPIPKRLREV